MVAAGIGAGIIIVILEVLYYKHKGWRKQQEKVMKKTTDQWVEHVQDRKNVRNDVSTKQNGTSNGSGLNNPVYENGEP